jgi:protein TonB
MSERARDESIALAVAVAASVILHALALAFGGHVRHGHQFEPPRVLSVLLPEREAPAPKLTPPAPLPPAPAKAEPTPPKATSPAPQPKAAPRVEQTRPILATPEPNLAAPSVAPAPVAPPPASSSPAAAPTAAAVGGGSAGGGESVAPPSYKAAYLQNPAPRYPAAARRNGEEGTVLLRVLVTPDGKAAKVEVDRTSGSPVLDSAAADAVSRWRFVPARRGADPVEAWVVVPMVFRLEAAN